MLARTRGTSSSASGADDGPPAVPKTDARISLTTKQVLGLPLIAAVPLLALLGVFGERATTTVVRSNAVEVTATFPARFRYRQIQALRVSVRNTSPRPLDIVFVSFDTAYIARFSSVRFDPAVTSAFVVPISHLAAGASGLVSVELWGEQYGRHRGRVVVTAGSDSVSIPISSFVFP
jgi:hypothetical protein